MKITKIKVYQARIYSEFLSFLCVLNPQFSLVDLPLVDGSYKWADGKSVGTYDSTIVVIHTDHPDGIVG